MHNRANIPQTTVRYVNSRNKAINENSKEVKKPHCPALGTKMQNGWLLYSLQHFMCQEFYNYFYFYHHKGSKRCCVSFSLYYANEEPIKVSQLAQSLVTGTEAHPASEPSSAPPASRWPGCYGFTYGQRSTPGLFSEMNCTSSQVDSPPFSFQGVANYRRAQEPEELRSTVFPRK